MRERTHLVKTEQPRDLGYMQLAVIEVTSRQIASQLLKYPFALLTFGVR